MSTPSKIVVKHRQARKWISIGITVLLASLLTVWGVYGIGEYGIALFFATPFFIGAASVILYGYNNNITRKDAWQTSLLALGIYAAGLLLFAMEGIICIVMAAPLGILLAWIGGLVGFAIVNKIPNRSTTVILMLIGSIPTLAFFESKNKPELSNVKTAIEIKASLETVWMNVVAFPQLDEPTEFIFKMGIAYPVNAKIEGTGVGAVRHCNFTTGSFVEPVTVWDEPNHLRFDVVEQPEPMKEISFWHVNAPHLHDYFVSKQGEFKLTRLPNGNTLLEGTTWYYHNIKPAIYWRLWSDYIIHQIHKRVLNHIKQNAESNFHADSKVNLTNYLLRY